MNKAGVVVGVDVDKAGCKREPAGLDRCSGDVLKGWSDVADTIAAKSDIEDFEGGPAAVRDAAIEDRGISD